MPSAPSPCSKDDRGRSHTLAKFSRRVIGCQAHTCFPPSQESAALATSNFVTCICIHCRRNCLRPPVLLSSDNSQSVVTRYRQLQRLSLAYIYLDLAPLDNLSHPFQPTPSVFPSIFSGIAHYCRTIVELTTNESTKAPIRLPTPLNMKLTLAAAVTGLAVIVDAKASFTNLVFTLQAGVPFNLTWSGGSAPYQIALDNGPANNLKDFQSLTSESTFERSGQTHGSSDTWISHQQYALRLHAASEPSIQLVHVQDHRRKR